MTSHGHVVLEWNSFNQNQGLERAEFCPTPEIMKEILLDDLAGYLEYTATTRNRKLAYAERQAIQTQVEIMSNSIQ